MQLRILALETCALDLSPSELAWKSPEAYIDGVFADPQSTVVKRRLYLIDRAIRMVLQLRKTEDAPLYFRTFRLGVSAMKRASVICLRMYSSSDVIIATPQ